MEAPTQTCLRCGNAFPQGYRHYFDGKAYQTEWLTATVCDDCEQTALFIRLTAEQQQQVDDLLDERAILQGILLLRRSLAIGLKESTSLFSWRYRQLKEENPCRFKCSDEEYWQGFYS